MKGVEACSGVVTVDNRISSAVLIIMLVLGTGISGCFESSTETTNDALDPAPKTTTNLPESHTDDVNGVFHGQGKFTPFSSWCTVCHGQALEGDLSTGAPPCTACHGQVWTELAPPAGGGGSTRNPPSNHTVDVFGFLHAPDPFIPYSSWCTACHGAALEGDLTTGGPACTTCHAQLWTENAPPTGGGGSTVPPNNHTVDVAGFLHAPGRFTPYSSWCTACHGAMLEGDWTTGAPACTTCHAQVWTEAAPPTGGGGSTPPSNHTDNVSGFLHAAGKTTPYSSWCTVCHGSTLQGNLELGAPSCTACHGQVWIETEPPTGGGSSNPPSNHTVNVSGFLHAPGRFSPYSSWCTACHGPALEGDWNRGAPSCTACHGQVWTEPAPAGGGGIPPSNHTDNVFGFLHAAGKTTPYSNWCTACHGATLQGNLDLGAPSCTACHGQVWTEAAPPGGVGGNPPSNHTVNVSGFYHAAGRFTPYSSWCTACHGPALEGDLDRGAPSCTACHGLLWTETSPPSSGGRTNNPPANHIDSVGGFLHAQDKYIPYTSWCSGCHGANLGGDIGPSCTACHLQTWTESPPPPGTNDLPASHTDSQHGFLHAPGKNAPYTNLCTVCHGADLRGYLGPSCYTCHGQEWSESGGTGGGGD